jgi:katanin p80 WD40 repeat-containing subunit B1
LNEATGSAPSTPQRVNSNSGSKTVSGGSTAVLNATTQKRSSLKSHTTSSVSLINKSDIIPVIVPRTSTRSEPVADFRKEVGVAGTSMPLSLQSRAVDIRKFTNSRDDVDKPPFSSVTEFATSKCSELSGFTDKNNLPASVSSTQGNNLLNCMVSVILPPILFIRIKTHKSPRSWNLIVNSYFHLILL